MGQSMECHPCTPEQLRDDEVDLGAKALRDPEAVEDWPSCSKQVAGTSNLFGSCSNNLRICHRVERVTYEFRTPTLQDTLSRPECWRYEPFNGRALVLRAEPRVDGPRTAHELEPGEDFEVDRTQREGPNGVLFMHLADGRGWAFEHVVTVGDLRGLMCVPAAAAAAADDQHGRPESFRAGHAFAASAVPAPTPRDSGKAVFIPSERGWIAGAVPLGELELAADHVFDVGERVRALETQSAGLDGGGMQRLAYAAGDEGTVVFAPEFEKVLTVRWDSGHRRREVTSDDVEELDLVVGCRVVLKHDIAGTATVVMAKGDGGTVEAVSPANLAVAFDKRKAEELPFVWVPMDQLETVMADPL